MRTARLEDEYDMESVRRDRPNAKPFSFPSLSGLTQSQNSIFDKGKGWHGRNTSIHFLNHRKDPAAPSRETRGIHQDPG